MQWRAIKTPAGCHYTNTGLMWWDTAERSTATDVLLMSPPGLRPPQNRFSRRSCCYSHVSRVQVCVYMLKTSQIPDDITLKCTTSTMIANRPGCFPSTWKLCIFLGFLPASHKYVSSSEPQAFQNIQLCFTKSRYEAQLVQGDLQSPAAWSCFMVMSWKLPVSFSSRPFSLSQSVLLWFYRIRSLNPRHFSITSVAAAKAGYSVFDWNTLTSCSEI